MLIEKLEMSAAPSLTNHTDFRDHRGVRPTKSGKWGAAIQHPITKASVWLGSYNTPKEAADAYIKKKLEYQSLSFPANSGKRGAKIQDPVNRELVCLGTGNSAAEGANVSTKKKLEFDSIFTNATVEEALNRKRCEAELVGQVEMKCKESDVHVKEAVKAHSLKITNQPSVGLGCSSLLEERVMKDRSTCDQHLAQAVSNTVRVKRLPGSGSVYRTKAGRWRAQISYRNSNVHVGTYTSYEEAEAAIHRKRQDLDNVAHVDEAVATEYRLEEHKLDPDFGSITTSKQSVALSESMEGQVSCSRPRGVYQRKSGRWYSEIRNPMTNSRGSVGTYDTAEEALEALNRKRRAYALINNAEKKLKQSNVFAEEDTQAHSGTITNYNVDLTDSKSWDIVAVRAECIEGNANVDDIQVPSSSFVSNQVFDTGVINAYGQLIGEFSKLDDELWLGESLNVDDAGCHKRLNILDEDAD